MRDIKMLPAGADELREQIADTISNDDALVDYLADRLKKGEI